MRTCCPKHAFEDLMGEENEKSTVDHIIDDANVVCNMSYKTVLVQTGHSMDKELIEILEKEISEKLTFFVNTALRLKFNEIVDDEKGYHELMYKVSILARNITERHLGIRDEDFNVIDKERYYGFTTA